jgi:alanine-alpha-ketoisovalerate/valine-pyruvate aminotransferase
MIVKKQKTNGIEIDLTGPQGNAFFLLGTASKLGRQLGFDRDEIEILLKEMKRGDYENLVNVFDKYFGSFVTLYR